MFGGCGRLGEGEGKTGSWRVAGMETRVMTPRIPELELGKKRGSGTNDDSYLKYVCSTESPTLVQYSTV